MGVKILFLSLAFQAFSVIFSNGYTVKYHDVSPATPTPIRLVNGYDRYSGRVEVFYRGRWGTICDDAFDRDDLHVICRMLGMDFGSSRGVVYTNAFFGYGSGPITIDDLQCKGNEHDIAQCPARPWLIHNCDHGEDAGVDCRGTQRHMDSTQQVPYATFGLTTNGYDRFGRIRLVNGQTSQSGRVEVYYNGRWGTVCDDKFGNRDAMVICRALFGYAYSGYDMVRRNAYYGQGSGDIIIDELECRGDEFNIWYCRSNPWGTHDCTHSEDVGVDCDSRDYIYYGMTTEAPTGRIRLVNGNYNSGRLEIYRNGEWMTVCQKTLSHDDVRVICRELGFDYGYRYGKVYGSGTYGQGSSYHIIHSLYCRGDENNVSKCAIYDHYRDSYCYHYQDAGIDCGAFYDVEVTTQPPVSVTAGRGVRLVNGYSTYGRVEIYRNGEWMTVCENTLSHNDVRVICRELGYYYGSQYGRIYGSSTYGSGSSYHIVHSLNCGGYESHISQCSIQSSTRNSHCYHYQDAGIDCGAYYIEHTTVRQYPTSVAPNSVRLVNGNGRYSGRVEIYHYGEWMNVCYRYLSQDDVRVICRQLGYYRGYEYGSIKGTGYYGQGSSYYIIDDLSCNGNENSLSQCRSVRYHSQGYYCSHTNDAGIDCYEYNPEPTTEAYNDGQVRLVGGSGYSGRVEVYHNHQWMTVCSNTLDHNDIKTICRSLGYYYGDNRGSKEYYSQGSTYNIIHYLGCYGYESSLSSCGIRYSYENHYCSHSRDAGINCYGYYYETTTSNPYWHIQTTAGSVLEDAILVSCNENGWDITINMYKLRQQYPTARADEIYLGENSCVGNDNGYDVHFTQGLRQCLTSQMIRNDVLVYRNQLIYAERDRLHPFLIRNYNWTVDVECDVMRNETSKGHLHHNTGGSSNHQISGTSHYSVNMTFYSDPNFRYQLYGFPLSVNVGDKVYVKVFTPNSDWTIKMKVHTCYTKPNDAASGYQKYFIIKNGCEVDGNTHIISQSSHETRFVFQDFEYTSNHEGIYIYCDATFCPSSDYSTSCRQTCNPVVRRRRLPDVMPYTKETSDKGDVDGEKVTEDPFVTTEATSNDEWTELP